MSFGSDPFHRFNGFNPESKLSEFRKRFEDFNKESSNRSKMLFDSMGTNGWPPLHRRPDFYSMAKNANMSNDSQREEDAIPIKVIHETSNERPNEEKNEQNSDSISNDGSAHSHKSSANTSSSSGSVFSNGQQTHESTVEPRVHHIPIKVEPRDGSTSSGYTSEPVVNPAVSPVVNTEQPLSRSSSNSSRSSGIARSPSPAKSVSSTHSNGSSNSSNNPTPRVYQIPVVVERDNSQKSKSPLNANMPKVKTNGLGQSRTKGGKTKSGPFVTRIPVVGQTNASPEPQTSTPEPPPNQQEIKSDPLEQINRILADLQKYEIEVSQFSGNTQDMRYRYLDEMLTRCMIKLDTIETEGKEEVRKARKAAVMAVNKCISLLESKVNTGSKTNQTRSSEQMVVSTPEPTVETNEKPIENVTSSQDEVEQMQVDENVNNVDVANNQDTTVANNQGVTVNQLPANENKNQKAASDGFRKETAV